MKALYKALAEARREFHKATKDSQNPHIRNRYASLNAVMDACDDALFKHGLVYTQSIACGDGPIRFGLVTRLVHHESGEEILSSCPLIFNEQAQNPMQSFGASVSYARRYSLQSLVGTQTDDDSDAEGAFPREQSTAKPYLKSVPKPTEPPRFRVDRKHIDSLSAYDIHEYQRKHEANIEKDDLKFLQDKWREKKTIERANMKVLEKRAELTKNTQGAV